MRLVPSLAPSFTSDRSWTFGVPADELWERLSSTAEYPAWWPWLVEFDATGGFRRGAVWSCVVEPPLPYRVRFRLTLEHVRAPVRVDARVSGDIRGDAVLTIVDDEGGSTARLRSDLVPTNPVLRGVGVVARPLVAWGHDWVLDSGQRQFLEHGVGGPGP